MVYLGLNFLSLGCGNGKTTNEGMEFFPSSSGSLAPSLRLLQLESEGSPGHFEPILIHLPTDLIY